MPPALDELKQSHEALLDRYLEVLNETTRLPFWVPTRPAVPPDPKWWKRLPRWIAALLRPRPAPKTSRVGGPRFLVQTFVESHIKIKLRELGVHPVSSVSLGCG